MKNWKTVRLGEVLKQSKNQIELDPEKTYRQVTIRMNRKGVVLRGLIQGNQVGSKQFLAKSNQFIVSRIDARNGAYGIVPKELEGAIVTNDFLLFETDTKIDVDFLNYYSNTSIFGYECNKASEGTTNRVRLKIDKFLNIEISLPQLAEQQRIVAKLKTVQKAVEKVRILRGEQGRLVRNLMYSKYCELVENAEWRPMKEVAPIIRREVEINEQKSYAELGIRSFGKGTFHKPPLGGIDVGTKRLYAIKPKDLLFSNVFAWEGAIAVATANDDNRYGSHRFISCKTDENQTIPEFLCFHFLTEKGLEDINAASPGGAGRNKTLGLQKLEKIKVPIPPLSMQQDFIAIKARLEALRIHQNTQHQAIEGLLPSMLDKAFKGEI